MCAMIFQHYSCEPKHHKMMKGNVSNFSAIVVIVIDDCYALLCNENKKRSVCQHHKSELVNLRNINTFGIFMYINRHGSLY